MPKAPPVVVAVTIMLIEAVIVIGSLGIGLAILARSWAAIRWTTLVGPWMWSVLALVAWAGIELAVAASLIGSGSSDSLRFAAIALSFCPIVGVLGAKRPQHVAWSFVVLSLWAIVALPAAENFFLHPGQRLSLGDARAWFLWILVLLGPINYVPTRFWLAALLFATGQVFALSPYLALVHRPLIESPTVVGLVFVVAALLAAWTSAGQKRVVVSSFDRAWLDFRDAFGLLWGLRVQERVNAVALQNRFGTELTWSGLQAAQIKDVAAEHDPTVDATLKTALKGILRRFAGNDWINERLTS